MDNLVLLWFDEPLAWGQLCQVIHEQLVERFPRFRQRAVPHRWGFWWEDAEDFRLEQHLRRAVLPAPGGRAELEALASQARSTPLDRSRPLWEMQLVEGYGQGSALLIRVHHSLADGMALMRVILSLMADSPRGQPPLPAPRRAQEPGRQALARARWADGARWVAAAGRLLVMRPDPPSPLRGLLAVQKQVLWSDPLPLTVWGRMGRGTGATVNDVFLAVVAGAVGRYLREYGAPVEALRANVAVQLRQPLEPLSQAVGNKLGGWVLPLPVRERDPLSRLREVYQSTRAQKRSLTAGVYRDGMALAGKTRLTALLGRHLLARRCSLVVSNMRGPRTPIFLTGRRVAGVIFWMPMVLDVGLGVTFCSQAGAATLGVATDTRLIAHPRAFLLALFEAMRELAGRDLTLPPLHGAQVPAGCSPVESSPLIR